MKIVPVFILYVGLLASSLSFASIVDSISTVNLNDGAGNPITSDADGYGTNRILHVKTPDATTAVTALNAAGATLSISVAGLQSAGFQLAAGTFIGTLLPEASVDGGTTWVTSNFYNPATQSLLGAYTFSAANPLTVLGVSAFPGVSNLRVRVTAYTSGTANAIMRAATVPGSSPTATITAAFGSISNTTPTITSGVATLLVAANPSRKYLAISNFSNKLINVQFGSGTGLSTTTGIPIPVNSFYEFKGDNLFTGAVYGYVTGGNVGVYVAEGTP
jgi:hypothetical protein